MLHLIRWQVQESLLSFLRLWAWLGLWKGRVQWWGYISWQKTNKCLFPFLAFPEASRLYPHPSCLQWGGQAWWDSQFLLSAHQQEAGDLVPIESPQYTEILSSWGKNLFLNFCVQVPLIFLSFLMKPGPLPLNVLILVSLKFYSSFSLCVSKF